MKRILSIALSVCPALACGSGSETPAVPQVSAAGTPAASARPERADEWVLAVHSETETAFEGTSTADAAFEFVVPERGDFTASAVLRLREYPRNMAGCTILSSSGYEVIPLVLNGSRAGGRLRLRESTPARRYELTTNCDELIVTTPTLVEASEHEFEMALREGETFEYQPPDSRRGRTIRVRYTLMSRAFVDERIRARGRTRAPIEVCAPTAAGRSAIQAAIEAGDHGKAIELATRALGLARLGPIPSIVFDPTILDRELFGSSREDLTGKLTIRLGPSAVRDAPVLLSTILHEVVGHAVLGLSEHDPEYSRRWAAEELVALRIEAASATTLGLSAEQLARIGETLTKRRAALKDRDPDLEAEIGRDLESQNWLTWVTCPDEH